LRRVFGFVACAGLLTASPWWVSLGETAEPARVREAAANADSSASTPAGAALSASQLFQQGRQDYLAGRYDESVAALEAASRASRDLSDSDRERLPGWLAQARSKMSGAKAPASKATASHAALDKAATKTETPAPQTGVVVRGQSADVQSGAGPSQPATRPTANTAAAGSSDPKSTAANKQKLAEARHKFNAGKIAEAEKLANECKRPGARNRMFGDSAEKLLEDIKICKDQDAAWKKDSSSPAAKISRSNYLVARARTVLDDGDAANADRLLSAAEKIQVLRGPNDLKPEELRQQLAGIGNGSQKAAGQNASGKSAAGQEVKSARSDGRRSLLEDENSLELPSEGVITADASDRELRSTKVETASFELPADNASADDKPANGAAAAKESKSPKKFVRQNPSKSAADRARADELLKEAQALLQEGRPDEARIKVQQAEKLDVAYDVLGDTPEYVLTLIERAERDTMLAQKATAGEESPEPAARPAQVAARQRDLRQTDDVDENASRPDEAQVQRAAKQQETARAQAQSLMKEAQADFEAGRLVQAKAKANRASELDVTWDLLEMTPDNLLDEVARIEKENRSAEKTRQLTAQSSTTDDMPSLDDEPRSPRAEQVAQAADEVDAPAAVNPTRISALELYQRGKLAIRGGDTVLAVQCFRQAYESGERLDVRKDQEIREYLAQHRMKARKIQLLAARQVPDSELGQAANDELPKRAIDKFADQRQIAVDKLRTEIRNATFRAEGLSATEPQQALEIIDKAQASVENSGLDERVTGQLLKQLGKSRETVEYNRKINAPRVEMAKRKAEVESAIKREEGTKVRIEQEYAELVEKYNQFFKEKRFEEAILLGKKAQLMLPENPMSELMVLKARYAKQDDFNKNLREKKADMFTKQLNDVELAATGYVEFIDYGDPQKWLTMSTRRKEKYGRADNHIPSPEERKIERSLSRDVFLHFDNAPLTQVINRLKSLAEVNIVLDPAGLEEEGVTSNTNVSINVDGIQLKSALNLILRPLHLGYTITNDVLKITSRMKQQGELVTLTYSVADLVVPIRDFAPVMGSGGMISTGFNTGVSGRGGPSNMGQMNVTSTGGFRQAGFAQVEERETSRRGDFLRGTGDQIENNNLAGGVQADFTSLMNLISTTVQPDSWEDLSGPGSMMPYRTTLSLVIRQTQAVHEEIADLLGQLRRLQDLQVTIECRFITVEDNFFERIGIDFNFNLASNVNNHLPNTFGQPVPPFGTGIDFTAGGNTGTSGTSGSSGTSGTSGTSGSSGTQGTSGTNTGTTGTGGGAAPFTPGPTIDTHDQNNWPRYGDIVGLLPTNSFANNLNIPFNQGSFGIGVPTFGNFNPAAGLQVGFAILSDIETFFIINAAQGDTRNNLLFAPKVTLFNGQTATVTDTVQRPFVTSLTPTVGFGSVGFTPQITVLPEGVSMTVQAVISADRRYVRLTVIPSFTAITDVQTFSFASGIGVGGQSGFGGGTVGGQGGTGGGVVGVGGIGGSGGTSGQSGQSGQQGQQGQAQQGQAGSAATQVTIQRPIFEIVSVATTVSVPDGGTVLLGGIKRLREGRNMAGVPILNKIPYVSRLFKNTGVGRETQSLMLMVTPRIIIQEEEEELLGVDLPKR